MIWKRISFSFSFFPRSSLWTSPRMNSQSTKNSDNFVSASDCSGSGATFNIIANDVASATDLRSSNFIANDIAVSWLQRTFVTDNRQRASDHFTIECSSLTIKQPPVHLMTSASDAALAIRQSSVHLTSSRLIAAIWASTASHLIAMGSDATSLTSRQPPVHLTVSRLGAAVLTTKQLCQCTRWPQHWVQQSWSQTTLSVHLMVSRSGAASLASHSFDHFLTSLRDRWLAPIHIHLIKFSLEKALIISTLIKDYFHTVNTRNFSKNHRKTTSKITVNQRLSKWPFQRLSKWSFKTVILNDHSMQSKRVKLATTFFRS